jgi:hypothetical protein
MTVHRIISPVLRAQGDRFESADRKAAERRLAEIKQRDPKARLVTITGPR